MMRRRSVVLAGVVVAALCGMNMFAQGGYSFIVAAGSSTSGSRDGAAAEAQFFGPRGIARDSAGNTFVADEYNFTIRRIASTGTVTTFAGTAGQSGTTDGTGAAARFIGPRAMAIDSSARLFVLDVNPQSGSAVVRRITSDGVVTTMGAAAGLISPAGISVDSSDGSVYVANTGAHTIVRITALDVATVFAGAHGMADAVDGTATVARFRSPHGVLVDPGAPELRLWVTDKGNFTIRQVDASGTVATVYGAPGQAGTADGADARFAGPSAIAYAGRGPGRDVWIVDEQRNCFSGSPCSYGPAVIRNVGSYGTVSTVTGITVPTQGLADLGIGGIFGTAEGMVFTRHSLNTLFSATITVPPGAPYHSPLRVGTATVFAGRGSGCVTDYALDGSRLAARFCSPRSVVVAQDGTMFVSDAGNANIRRVAPDGSVTTLAGSTGLTGSADGVGTAARFGNYSAYPRAAMGIDLDGAGNVWVADTANSTIRRISPDGTTVTIAGVAGSTGSADGVGAVARFNQPHDLAIDSAGNVFVVDTGNSSIRRVTPAGVVTTFAGQSGAGGSADGPATSARFNAPYGIAVGADDALYIADTGNHTIRRISTAGVVSTIAGQALSAGTVDGTGSAVRFNAPQSLVVDAGGQVFVGSYSSTIRRIATNGTVSTISSYFSCGTGCTDGYGAVTDVDAAGTLYLPHNGTIVVGTTAGATSAAPAFTTHPTSQTITAGQGVSFTVAASGVPAATYRWQMSSDGGTSWFDLSDTAPYSGTTTATLTLSTTSVSYPLLRFRAIATNALGTATSNAATLTVPGLHVTPTSLRFRAVKSGAACCANTGVQEVHVTFVGVAPAAVQWTSTHPWLWAQHLVPGVDAGWKVFVADSFNQLGSATSASGTVTLSVPSLGLSAQIAVSLEIVLDPTLTNAPIGQVDTPAQGATSVRGAISLSGWATDDTGVDRVEIYRNCLAAEPQANCQAGVIPGRPDDRVVFVGNAQLVPGARPDIDAAFPSQVSANRAGWGYLLLTSMLPRTSGAFSPYGGQGPVTLYAVATDRELKQTLLGRSWSNDATPTTITLDNDAIAKPFGSLDTPAQGQRITTSTFNNFGWVLTPDSDTIQGNGDISMANTSGLTLFVDGLPITAVTYNQCRGDVGNPPPPGVFCNDDVSNIFGNLSVQASLTPRIANPTVFRNLDAGRGAIGSAVIDVTTLANGLHTIAWSATDSAGRVEGIGSRFFSVLRQQTTAASKKTSGVFLEDSATKKTPDVFSEVTTGVVVGRAGFDLQAPWSSINADADGVRRVHIDALGRMELWLGGGIERGALMSADSEEPLPVGSQLKTATGQFTWMPGPGFRGTYALTFMRGGDRVSVDVTIRDAQETPAGDSEIRMDAPVVRGCETLAALDCNVGGAMTLTGRAWDPQAFAGSGIGTVHVWAERKKTSGVFFAALSSKKTPDVFFLGEATLNVDGTYSLTHTLDRGMYDVTAYVWNIRTARFEDARTVRVTVR
jgi:hypothetical protein